MSYIVSSARNQFSGNRVQLIGKDAHVLFTHTLTNFRHVAYHFKNIVNGFV